MVDRLLHGDGDHHVIGDDGLMSLLRFERSLEEKEAHGSAGRSTAAGTRLTKERLEQLQFE